MAKKIRKQTLALKSYLEKMKEENQEIRSDQDVQRLAGQWDNSMINELIATVLLDDYIPPIILGEEEREDETTQLWIIDGLQRSSTLSLFRYGNYRVTSSVEESVIEYQKNRTENGKVCRDEDGNLIKETIEFDIKGKTFEELPSELKKKFDDYQLEMAIHQNCTMEVISKLIRRYNNHRGMNTIQKAFTYINNFARKIRGIVDMRFFKDCGGYTEKEKTNGGYERIVMESVMAMFHLDNWKKTPKNIGKYLNDNASDEEFDILRDVIARLEPVISDKYIDIFNMKDSFIWFTFFYRFLKYKVDDDRFADFLDEFRANLHIKVFAEYDDNSFDTIDEGKGTKDKKVIIQKLDMLEKLMMDFLHINIEETHLEEEFISDENTIIGIEDVHSKTKQSSNTRLSVLDFVRENVDSSVTEEDIELYKLMLLDYEVEVSENDEILSNKIPLISMVSYVCKKEVDDKFGCWLAEFSMKNNTYNSDSKTAFEYMVKDFDNFIENENVVLYA